MQDWTCKQSIAVIPSMEAQGIDLYMEMYTIILEGEFLVYDGEKKEFYNEGVS